MRKAVGMSQPKHTMTKNSELGYFAPKTWVFWRSIIVCFCIFTIVGHWLEIPYCLFMDSAFGIVADDYAVWTDPWYHPYWVYGFGAVVMTLVIEPFKERMIMRRKTLFGAFLESLVFAILLAMVMELVIGWIVNQPNEFGKYPYWDNSQLPLNIFGQAWLVNDVVIGLVAMIYVWILYPLICRFFRTVKPDVANAVALVIVLIFVGCCTVSYLELWLK